MKKVSLPKEVLSWLIRIAVIGTYVLYFVFDWTTAVANISKLLDSLVKTVALIFIASTLMKITSYIVNHTSATSKKGQTVTKLLASIAKYAIGIISFVVALGYFIEDTSALITGVSMLTLVVGLGMQSLIADVVAGIFIVFEGSYQVGDTVVVDGWRGKVAEIGLRTTKIEDAGGNIQIINNSQINKVINNSSNSSLAICDVGIEYGESIERVENIIAKALPKMAEKLPAIVEGPYYKGVDSLGDFAVVIKIIAMCNEDDKFQLQRDLNREIKILFDANNIGIPFPNVTLSYLNSQQDNEVSGHEKVKAQKFVEEQAGKSKGLEEQEN